MFNILIVWTMHEHVQYVYLFISLVYRLILSIVVHVYVSMISISNIVN